MRGISFSRAANQDIEEIGNYIFDLNPVAADRFLTALEKTCELLAKHPLIGRSRPELGEGIRSFAIGRYLIFYLPDSERINVVRVIYGGRDVPEVFHRPETG